MIKKIDSFYTPPYICKEKKKGYRTDPCVEDQFRLAVYFAKTKDYTKKWWNFTLERKQYREKFGYPKDRPELNWYEVN